MTSLASIEEIPAGPTRERLSRNLPAKPELSEAERQTVKQCLWMLEQVTKPSLSQPEALIEAVKVAMIELPFRLRSSEEHYALTLKVWADAVRDYPLYAVQKAAKWWSQGARDGDELQHFIADVRFAVGKGIRRKLLESLA